MASFSSGVMISKSEAERRRGDELRMRKQGLDPNRDNKNWGGAVVSRRQHKPSRVEKEDEKEREEAESLPLELKDVIGKRPENRLKWLQRALVLAGKKRVKLAAIYDIVQHKKFLDGISDTMGKQMKQLLLANLHLFSQKQQRALQAETCKLSNFGGDKGLPRRSGRDFDRNDSGSSCSSRGYSRSRTRPRSRSRSADSCERQAVGRRVSPGPLRSERRASPGPSRAARRRRGDVSSTTSTAAAAAAAAPVEYEEEEATAAAEPVHYTRERSRSRSQPERQPTKLTGLKMKLQPWQPEVLRVAATAPLASKGV